MMTKKLNRPSYKALHEEAIQAIARLRTENNNLKTEAYDKELDKTSVEQVKQDPYDLLVHLLIKTSFILTEKFNNG
jgi:hypothetical protein